MIVQIFYKRDSIKDGTRDEGFDFIQTNNVIRDTTYWFLLQYYIFEKFRKNTIQNVNIYRFLDKKKNRNRYRKFKNNKWTKTVLQFFALHFRIKKRITYIII